LDVRREVEKVHDLSDPRSGHPAQAGQVGVIAHNAAPDQPVEVDGECHQARDARDSDGRRRFFWRDGALPHLLLAGTSG